jgi:hypothetical protein
MRTYDFEDSEVLRLHELGFRFDLVYRVWDPTRNFNFWNFILRESAHSFVPRGFLKTVLVRNRIALGDRGMSDRGRLDKHSSTLSTI